MTSNFVNFLLETHARLITETKHTSSVYSLLTVVLGDEMYDIELETIDSIYELPIGAICKFFQNGLLFQIQLSNGIQKMNGFICFDNIPDLSGTGGELFLEEQREDLRFNLRQYKPEYMDIRFATPSDRGNTASFALGCFKYSGLFMEFRSMIFLSDEYRIPVIWEMFIRFLRKIRYFDIFNINHFQSFVLTMFLRMISVVNKKSVRRNLLLSFIKKFLSDNCWFMIIGGKYRAILGSPSKEAIQLFSNSIFPPTISFVDKESGFAGLIIRPYLKCVLIEISTTQVSDVGPLKVINDEEEEEEEEEEPSSVIVRILDELRGHGVKLNNFPELLRRRPDEVDMRFIPHGVLRVCEDRFILFVFKTGNYLNFFIQRPDGRFECFCPYFFIMLHMFSDNDRLMNQLKIQFENFSSIEAYILVEALVCDCGFEPIFDRTATSEQVHWFLFKSVFGRLFQWLICDFVSFPERLLEHCSKDDKEQIKVRCECLQKNLYVSHLRLIFEMILERLKGRPDLGQEIQETLSSLNQLVKFLTIPPDSK